MEIEKTIIKQIVSEAYSANPLECCGYLAGNDHFITHAYPMKNIDQSNIHYSFEPKEQFKTVKDIRNRGMEVLGVYHSHPETPARPSKEDIRLAYDPQISYVIISLCDEKSDVKSFKIVNGKVEQEELLIK